MADGDKAVEGKGKAPLLRPAAVKGKVRGEEKVEESKSKEEEVAPKPKGSDNEEEEESKLAEYSKEVAKSKKDEAFGKDGTNNYEEKFKPKMRGRRNDGKKERRGNYLTHHRSAR